MKTSIVNTIFLLVFLPSIYAQNKIWKSNENSKYGLKNDKEKILIDATFDKLGWSDGIPYKGQSFIGYYENGWGLISSKGKILTTADFVNLIPTNDDIVIASKATKTPGVLRYGLLNSKGKELLPFKYQSLKSFHNGLFVYQDSTLEFGIVNAHGKLFNKIKFDELNPYSKAYYQINQAGKIGLIDTFGNLILKPVFKSIDKNLHTTNFGKIEIRTRQNDLLQSIEADSAIVLSNESIAIFSNSFVTVYDKDMNQLINEKQVLRLEELDYNIAIYTQDGVYLFTKKNNRRLQVFEDIEPGQLGITSTKLIAVKKGGLWGYVNSKAEVKIDFQFKSASAFINDIAIVETKKKKYLINNTGRRIGFIDYDNIIVQGNNTAIGKRNDRSELIDSSGAILFEVYGDIIPHSLGYLTVNQFGDYGLINEFGETILNPIHQKISEVINDKYMVVKTPSRLGLTLLDGTWFYWLTGDFQDMKAITENFIGIQRNNQWGYINYKKQLLIANRYDNIRCFYNHMAAVSLNGGWGFIDEREKLIVQPTFDEISDFESGFAIVTRDEKLGIINSFGQLTTKIEYDSLIRLKNKGDQFIAIKNNKLGLINAKGKQIISIAYSNVSAISENFYLVSRRNLKGIMNRDGVFSIPLKYTKIELSTTSTFICYLPLEDSI